MLTSAALLTRASIKTVDVVAKHASLRFSVGNLFDCIVILAGDGYIGASTFQIKKYARTLERGRVHGADEFEQFLCRRNFISAFGLCAFHTRFLRVKISRFYGSV